MNQIQKVMLFTESSQMSVIVEQENHSLPPPLLPPSPPDQKRYINTDRGIYPK